MAVQKKKTAASRATKSAKISTSDTKKQSDGAYKIPIRLISASVFFVLFFLFLASFFNAKGVIPDAIAKLMHGLIGRVGFAVSIPALLYLFIIHAFSKGRPVIMRSVCLGCFVLICGSISHLSISQTVNMSASALYFNGIKQTSAGLLCGAIAMLVFYCFNSPLSYIVLVVAGVFTLLGGMQITILSIVRAVKNRPRSEIEDEFEEPPEPAAIVVNHLANKRIEHLEQRRERRLRKEAEAEFAEQARASGPRDAEVVADMFRQIESDIETPVSVASEVVPALPI